MYYVRQEGLALDGKVGDYEAHAGRLVEMLQRQPGFKGFFLMNSLDQPLKYVSFTNWVNRDACRNFLKSEAAAAFSKANPTENLIDWIGTLQAFDLVADAMAPGRAKGATPRYDTIERTRYLAFGDYCKDLLTIRRDHEEGCLGGLVLRQPGDEGRFLRLAFFTEIGLGKATPQLTEFLRTRPQSEFVSSPPDLDRWEVILQV